MNKHYYISGNGQPLAGGITEKNIAELFADDYKRHGYKDVTIEYR